MGTMVASLQHLHWAAYAVAGWVFFSVLAAPVVGWFISGALRERADSRSSVVTRKIEAPRRPRARVGVPAVSRRL